MTPAALRRVFCALGTVVEVSLDDGPSTVPAMRADLAGLIAGYADSDGRAVLRYRLQLSPSPVLWRNGIALYRAGGHPEDLLAALEAELYAQAVRRCADRLWLLHGAAVARDGQAVVLVGPSGAGKSTLALALTTRGATYLSDECVAIDEQGAVSGLSRPLTFAANKPPVVEPRRLRHFDRSGGASGSIWLQPPAAQRGATATLQAIALLRHRPEGPAGQCRRLSPGEALCALWPECLRPTPAALSSAERIIAGVNPRLFEVVTRDEDGGCTLIEPMWSATGEQRTIAADETGGARR